MNKIIILRGNGGSGKSTTALALQKKLGRGTFMIPQDTVRMDMLWVSEDPNNKAISLLETLVEFGSKNHPITILEGVLCSSIYQSLFRRVTELFGKQIHAYYFDVPFEETVIRQKQRPIHNKWSEEQMRKWWREKDYLNFIPEKTIDAVAMGTDEIVEIIIKDISLA